MLTVQNNKWKNKERSVDSKAVLWHKLHIGCKPKLRKFNSQGNDNIIIAHGPVIVAYSKQIPGLKYHICYA